MAATIVLQGNSLVVIYPSGKTKNTGIMVAKSDSKSAIAGKVAQAKNIGIGGASSTEDALAINGVNAGAIANSIYAQLNPPEKVEAPKPAPRPAPKAEAAPKPKTEPRKVEPKPRRAEPMPEPRRAAPKPEPEEEKITDATPRHNITIEWMGQQIDDSRSSNDKKSRDGISNIYRYSKYVDKFLETSATRGQMRTENQKKATVLVFSELSKIPKFTLYLSSQASVTPEFTSLLSYTSEKPLDESAPDEIIEAADFFIRHYLLAFEARDNGSDEKYVSEIDQLGKTHWRKERAAEVVDRVEGKSAEAKKTEERKAAFRRIYLGGAMDAETITASAVYIRRWEMEKVHKRDPKFVRDWEAPEIIPLRGEEIEIKVPNIAIIGASINSDGTIANEIQRQLQTNESKSKVTNYSRDGRTTNDYAKIYDKSALRDEHNVVIISGYARVNEPKTTTATFTKRMEELVMKARENNKKVIIIGIPPIKGYKYYSKDLEKKVDEFNEWARTNPDVIYVDPSSLTEGGKLKSVYDYGDGLHLNNQGQRELARLILEQGFGHTATRVKSALEIHAESEWKGLESRLYSAVSRRDPESIVKLEEIPADVKRTMPRDRQTVDDALDTLGRDDVRNAFDQVYNNLLLRDPDFNEFVKSRDRYKVIAGQKLAGQSDKDRKVFVEAAQAYIQDRMKKDERFSADMDILQRQVYKKKLTYNGLDSMETLAAISLYRWREQNKSAPVGKWAEDLNGIRIPKTTAPAPERREPPPSKKDRVIRF